MPCAWLCSHWFSVSSNHHIQLLPSKEWIMFMSSSLRAYYMVVYVAQKEQLLIIHLLGSALNFSFNVGCCTISELVGVNEKTSNTCQELSCWLYYIGATHTRYTFNLLCPNSDVITGFIINTWIISGHYLVKTFLKLLEILSSFSPLKQLTLCCFWGAPWELPKQRCVWTFLCKKDGSGEHLRLYSLFLADSPKLVSQIYWWITLNYNSHFSDTFVVHTRKCTRTQNVEWLEESSTRPLWVFFAVLIMWKS